MWDKSIWDWYNLWKNLKKARDQASLIPFPETHQCQKESLNQTVTDLNSDEWRFYSSIEWDSSSCRIWLWVWMLFSYIENVVAYNIYLYQARSRSWHTHECEENNFIPFDWINKCLFNLSWISFLMTSDRGPRDLLIAWDCERLIK